MIEVILALIALAGNCGWLIDHKRHAQETRKAGAEADQAGFDLSRQYVQEFREQIFTPMAEELAKTREAFGKISDCVHQSDCPVVLHLSHGSGGDGLHPDDDNGQPADGGLPR